jgi:hypothetical protein
MEGMRETEDTEERVAETQPVVQMNSTKEMDSKEELRMKTEAD